MFAFTSVGGQIGPGPYVFKINGQNHHKIGSLLSVGTQKPGFESWQAIPSYLMDLLEMVNQEGVPIDDKVKDLKLFFIDVILKMISSAPESSMEEETYVLKEIISYLEVRLGDYREKVKNPKEAMNSLLEEIYKMPGSFVQLKTVLESQDDLTEVDKWSITEKWTAQTIMKWREEECSAPQEDIQSRDIFHSKVAEFVEAREKVVQLTVHGMKLDELLRSAKEAFFLVVWKSPDHKEGLSISLEMFCEDFIIKRTNRCLEDSLRDLNN